MTEHHNGPLPEELRAEVLRGSAAAATGRRLAAALAHGDDEAVNAIVHEIGTDALYVVMSLAIDNVALARTCYRQHAETYLDRQALMQLDIAEDNRRGFDGA